MADIMTNLKETLNGTAPQHQIHKQSQFEVTQGSDGALHTKIVDQNGNPITTQKVEITNQKDFPTDYPDSAVKTELEQTAT